MNFKKIKMMSLATAMMVGMVGSTNAWAANIENNIGDNYGVNAAGDRQHIDAVDNEGTVEAALETDVTCKVAKNHFTLYAPTEIGFGELEMGENVKEFSVAVATSSKKPVSADKRVVVNYETDGLLVGDRESTIDYSISGADNTTECAFTGTDLWEADSHTSRWTLNASTQEIGFTDWSALTEGNYKGSVTFRAELQDNDVQIN